MDAKEFVREFITKMNTQSNRMTATPYYYVIKSAKWIPAYPGCDSDRKAYVDNENPECVFYVYHGEDAIEKMKLELEDYDIIDEINEMDSSQLYDYLDEHYTEYEEKKTFEDRCCFLTEDEAERHLRENKHHYSPDAHTYIKHFWRAPDVKRFFESVAELVGLEYVNH